MEIAVYGVWMVSVPYSALQFARGVDRNVTGETIPCVTVLHLYRIARRVANNLTRDKRTPAACDTDPGSEETELAYVLWEKR